MKLRSFLSNSFDTAADQIFKILKPPVKASIAVISEARFIYDLSRDSSTYNDRVKELLDNITKDSLPNHDWQIRETFSTRQTSYLLALTDGPFDQSGLSKEKFDFLSHCFGPIKIEQYNGFICLPKIDDSEKLLLWLEEFAPKIKRMLDFKWHENSSMPTYKSSYIIH